MGNLHSSKKFNPSKDIVDLSGRAAIVTGANVGIGYSTVKFLARRGAKVYLAARNESKGAKAAASLELEGQESGGKVVFLKLDLADPRMAKESAQEFLSKETRLDILINNAGIYLGPYVFTRTLLDLLIKTAQEPESDVRIINLSSQTHRMTKPSTDFGQPGIFRDECKSYLLSSFARYAVSKYAINLWTTELQRRLDETLESARRGGRSILVMSVHPGSVNTFAHYFPFPRLFNFLFSRFMTRPDDGASTSLFAAASPRVRAEPDTYRGQYMLPVGVLTSTPATQDAEMAGKLWDTTESFLQELGVL
ncbi:NAD(P)-binding protein [Mycena leptocephala]|nr:NAD(P)-binding protein [Mycena leptocephala]